MTENIHLGDQVSKTSAQSVEEYKGFDSNVDDNIQHLARKLTNASQSSLPAAAGEDQQYYQNNNDLEAQQSLSRVSTIAPGVVAINNPDIDPRLDPNSDQFNSRFWVKNFKNLMDKDPEHYKSYSLGIAYKNLRATGEAAGADYQTTVMNAPLKYANLAKKAFFTSKAKKEAGRFDILKSMDALVRPGEVVVVLGRPGSGCSTLLKTIASNTHGFAIGEEAEISYEGLSPKDIRKHYRGEVVYNAESDIHFPHLTVWQTLSTVAKFRTPQNRIPGISREDYANHLTEVYMATYGLSHTKNTKVGNENVRGVSGGERKRVSIAEVSLSGARLQCWDNATRGLDAATALEFIRALRTQADVLDTTAFVAIYQCSQDAYDLFDKVTVLYEGHQIYFGRGDEAREYFIKMGWYCPQRQTTADFLTSVTSPRERVPQEGFENKVPKTPQEFETYWKNSPEYAKLIKDIDSEFKHQHEQNSKGLVKEAHNKKQAKHIRPTSSYTVSFWMQTRYLLTRDFQRIWNDFGFNSFQVFANSFMALILSSIFYNLPKTTDSFYYRGAAMFFAVLFNGFSSFLEIMTLFEARPIIEKHKQYSLYHPSANALSSVLSQLPAKIFTSIAFNLVFYFMVNFRRNPGRFFFYYLVNLTATFSMSHLFRLVGSAATSLPEALVPAQVLLLALTIFVGFTIPVNYMLGWSRWINYLDPLAYAFEALMANEFAGVTYDCSSFVPGDPRSIPNIPSDGFICNAVGAQTGEFTVDGTTYLEVAYKYKNSHRWRNWGITLAFALFFLAIYLVFSEYNESAMQKGEVLLFQRSTLRKLKKEKAASQNELESGNEKGVVPNGEDVDKDVDVIHAGTQTFHWRDVHYTVKIKKEDREILSGVDGWVKPGTLTALMGASGAGKTTLLDVLANRVTMGVVTGDMFVNGHLRDNSFQRSTGYVQQQDLHLRTATVREALKFSAYLRQPASVSTAEKDQYVEEVISILDMEKYADAVVGVAGEGLNVEQRKRLTIGVELAAKPKLLLFLDEPTSGLDSQTAWSICQLMRKLANHGQAILCTIHQPSAILMQEFDRLLFLARGGKTVYFGDLGKNCQTLIDYFEKYGAPKCPPEANPAEWMLHVIGAAPGSHANQDYYQVWLNSTERQEVKQELDRMERELSQLPRDDSIDHNEYAAPFWKQYGIVTQRVFQQYWRSPIYIYSKLFLAISSSMFIGFAFFKAKNTRQGLQNQMFALFMFLVIFNALIQQTLPEYVRQRELYEVRERPSKTFSWKAFITAQITSEVPWNALVGTIAFLVFYYPVGFYNNAAPNGSAEVHDRGAYAWFLTVLFFVYTGSFAHLVIAPLELADAAGNLASLIFTLCLTFCGVLVTSEGLPGFWIFMYRVSPFTYFIDGFLSNAVAHNVVKCSDSELVHFSPPQGATCGDYMKEYLEKAGTGYVEDPSSTSECGFCSISSTDAFLKVVKLDYGRRWRNVGIFIAFIVINWILAVFFYWLARVPKKNDRVKSGAEAESTNKTVQKQETASIIEKEESSSNSKA
ncbi:Multidrug resistance protein [Wickerhamomyces ciferrii]|uniref:Multidrug resistance protein n=1 Tax=Wickerhamomyces ciferrii (strain ATCC 14091 / BCRC 22168 / CBS 111 / JCM 3599 / NBRC 0793 / NRRL Y-1031 F-60-10) TaxID=1206466 RepID=K0KSX0_WICCF|nr:Multidrug resistance protein [Wickerhamomyces ciferrii]CCH45147.1 Multidrug resistance protein [Wickerhamomyces ciferrii]